MPRSKTIAEFIKEAKAIHGDKYDYSKVEYHGIHEKVCIICPIHGEFWQTPLNHLHGHGCYYCGGSKRLDRETFIEKARKVHGGKYDYSKVEYINSHTKVCIICPIHGEFWQMPNDHLNGSGCKKCANKRKGVYKISNVNEFVEKAKKLHGDKYDYSKVEYVNNRSKVCIICPTHGEFWQTPHNHLARNGCPYCRQSKLEIQVSSLLNSNGIEFIYQYKSDWLQLQSIDFYLPKYNIAIECQGIQHFKPVERFGGIEGFKVQKANDELKMEKCKNSRIKLLYFSKIKSDNVINNENKLLSVIKELIDGKKK